MPAAAKRPPSTLMRAVQVLAPFVLLGLLWQIASFNFPKYLFPSLVDVSAHIVGIFSSWTLFSEVLATVGRILAGLIGAFVGGAVIAAVMFRFSAADRFLAPILNFFQGIPALSWVVFAIIWFHGTEPRIFFIMKPATLSWCTEMVLMSFWRS